MSSISQSSCPCFQRYIIGASYGKPPEYHGFKHVVALSLFINLDWCAQKAPLSPSQCPALLKDDELEVARSNDEDVIAPIDIGGYKATAYKCINI